ncbi:DUF4180 domain-containing protein [Paenibacillus sp. ISL-20]|uniref:DUF4180 domain-containing protein n=1 Tax=Paenibacillus sp. ISL-20 TaxID=2819163 RepID=UPI001BEA9642|nr:DUF4180 domain-containing protein [Paenibacillus sp. ISL-20]MBT2762944.1 DUF4180 domain-containing protein [Paenibacillus sp. ISL-20]
MNIEKVETDGGTIAVVSSNEIMIKDVLSPLDLMATVQYETGSQSLQDFIYECNKGNDFFFLPSEQQGIERLSRLN